MLAPRRFLPPTAHLQAFEAAARTGSITAAARELALTQSAVSRQIKALEDQLEVELFHRERQTIRLTPGGEAYAREIRDALKKISTASLNLRANPFGGSLNLAVLPTFGARWLAPRLPGFLSQNPGTTLNLITRLTAFDFRQEAMDAAIHHGTGDWPGAETLLLREEYVVPACSPALLERYRFETPADIRKAPLLHITTRPDAWERWLRQNDAPAEHVQGMLFDQFATMAQMARAGLGVALLPDFLIEEELRTGQLVRALDLPMKNAEAYYLVWPEDRADHPPLVAFRDWLVTETIADNGQ
ncbi:LysR family transcriptional regulator [Asticcacaulis taihuensis]|jgi:LysR family glycine cleavage system transcriptional activator|uniref:LysR family transcriptional regulator, glycine cleavage system transcriptional activator n=1 Tax=Asticcacaulis taihuensis TaxID=260084 RepID=A0A1G4QJC7_9CAUL|nr:LysR family transcriptional regulator [Asticcacaulis taihuensis]SCW44535.1 LysR family transcriptional regulator, glycine cleavage system transcriptional activator [Asticcacaulis taihuensis]